MPGLTQEEVGDGVHLSIAVMLAIEASAGNVEIRRWPRMDLSAPADKVNNQLTAVVRHVLATADLEDCRLPLPSRNRKNTLECPSKEQAFMCSWSS